MSDNTLSGLTSKTAVVATDVMYIVSSGNSRKITVDNFFRTASNVRLAGNVFLDAANAQTLTNSGTISLQNPVTKLQIDNSGGVVYVPNGVEGQFKYITLTTTDSSGTYWLASSVAANHLPANVLFKEAGDTVVLNFIGNVWKVVSVTDETMVQKYANVPAANSPGRVGEMRVDSGFLYVCVATDSWKKVALTSI
jgi:hypothetical protein